MNLIKTVLAQPFNWAIISAGIIWFIALFKKKNEFRDIKRTVDKENHIEEYDDIINTGSLSIQRVVLNSVKIDGMNKPREEFNNTCAKYGAWVQTISLFPLLGLLGTVWGMMPGLSEMTKAGNIDSLYNSLSFALTSTFCGLIASIALKLFTNFGPDKMVDDIEASLVEYDRKLEHLSVFQRFSKTEK